MTFRKPAFHPLWESPPGLTAPLGCGAGEEAQGPELGRALVLPVPVPALPSALYLLPAPSVPRPPARQAAQSCHIPSGTCAARRAFSGREFSADSEIGASGSLAPAS